MKRLLGFAVLLLALAAVVQAQYRPSGPPASVTSVQPNPVNGAPVFGPGATVTSGSFSPAVPTNRDRRHRHNNNGGFGNGGFGRGGRFGTPFAPQWAYSPTLIPVPVPVPVDANGNPLPDGSMDAESEDEAPAYTVFERRSRSAVPMSDYSDNRRARMTQPEPDAPQETAAIPEQPATVLVFRDGHQLEITNYAIQSGTLFNLSDKGPRKIALADLDVDRTVRANDERGVDFTVPAAR